MGIAARSSKTLLFQTHILKNYKKRFPTIIGYPVSATETKVAAGWLIDQAGWKGFREGDAGIHKKQALGIG